MTNPDKLQIVYSPARKSISFSLFQDGRRIPSEQYGFLTRYAIEKKGSFVLNLCGNDFFDDILKPFAGKVSVPVAIRTTRADYEDFKLMVDSYNQNVGTTKTKIELCEFTQNDELPDMSQAFTMVKGCGNEMVTLLDEAYLNIKNIPCQSVNSSTYISKIAERIRNESEKIKKNLRLLDDDRVTLCFIGAYGAGKSTLINALLGYRILPESIKSETAMMMQITGVPHIEDCFIEFSAKGERPEQAGRHIWSESTYPLLEHSVPRACIAWNEGEKRLCFSECTLDAHISDKLKTILSEHSTEDLYMQIYACLDAINDMTSDIDSLVHIGFPIPLDTEDLHYVINDTPGTGSNFGNHKTVLQKALSRQTNSIAIFVIKPDGVEGEANNILLNEILRQQDDKNDMLIDMEQSFFVINKMDPPDDAKYVLENANLQADGFSINLSEKKLFFLSAKTAYTVRARQNGITNHSLEDFYTNNVPSCYTSDYGKYYTHNHCGRSQYATEQMKRIADAELARAEENGDNNAKYLVCSGIYSLEEQIKSYGLRYASSVKTVAIIKSVTAASNSINRMVTETQLGTNNDIKDLQTQLDAEVQKIKGIISMTEGDFRTPPDSLNRQLGIDSMSFSEKIIRPVEDILKEKLQKFLKFFKAHVDEEIEEAVHGEISRLVQEYNEQYIERRARLLEQIREEFIKKLIEKIDGDETISDSVKRHIKNVTPPDIPDMGLDEKIGDLFEGATVIQYGWLKSLANAFVRGMEGLGEVMSDLRVAYADSSHKVNSTELVAVQENAGWRQKLNELVSMLKIVMGKVLHKVHHTVKNKADTVITAVKPKFQEFYENIQNLKTKTVSQEEFIETTKNFLYARQEEFTGKLVEDYTNALGKLCGDISAEFSGNIERYSAKIRALKEDNVPLEKLANCIEALRTAVIKISGGLEGHL